ncbi:MAG: hypothetical protein KKD44_13160 [Proteobacteria bacterium]|nr:hypothetical protein [Pseudomonadota bacterium]
MSKYKKMTEEASIVLVGSFNPAIFHPEWLLRHDLISEDDIDINKIDIVHPDLSKFYFDWLAIEVIPSKFTARTNDPSKYSPLRDLVVSIFNILEHTPINQLGLNLIMNFSISSEDDWHRIGDTLAPKEIWNASLQNILSLTSLNHRVGLKSLSITTKRNDDYDGDINISIGPSAVEKFSVNYSVNNHIELKKDKLDLSSTEVISNLWDKSVKMAQNLADTTLTEILQ